MIDSNNKKQTDIKNGFNAVAVAVTKIIVGAGLAVAGAVTLNNDRNRAKAKEVLTNVKDQAVGRVDKLKGKVVRAANAAKESFQFETTKEKSIKGGK